MQSLQQLAAPTTPAEAQADFKSLWSSLPTLPAAPSAPAVVDMKKALESGAARVSKPLAPFAGWKGVVSTGKASPSDRVASVVPKEKGIGGEKKVEEKNEVGVEKKPTSVKAVEEKCVEKVEKGPIEKPVQIKPEEKRVMKEVTEEKKKAEEERKRLEEERKKAEEDKKRIEEEKKAEEERKKRLEEERKRKAEEEKKRIEEEKRKAEEEKKRLEEEKKRLEEEKEKAEEEKRIREEEQKAAEELKKAEEKRKAEEEKKRAEEEKKKAEEEKQAAETTEEPDPNQLLVRRVANGVKIAFGVLDDVAAHTLTISLTREGTYKHFFKLQTGEEPLSFSYRGTSYAFSVKPSASVKDVRKRAIAVALRSSAQL